MKNYIVTGAGKGLGFAVTKKLIETNKDIVVYAVSRDVKNLIKLKNNRIKIIAADINKDISLIEEVIGKNKIHGLLNNAGVLIKKNIDEFNIDDFNTIYHTNVFAPFKLSVQLRKKFKKDAHIVNIGSMGGVEGTLKFPGMILYSSSKSALHCLTQCLSMEYEKSSINVNCLAIGSVETEMVKKAFPGFKPPIKPEQMAEFVADFIQNGHKYFRGQIIPVALTTP